MKHGVAFRKFSRSSSHRNLMLRNLVTSLFEHEQIKTTLPKARDTARLAEKIITLGKKGGLPAYRRAAAFLLKYSITPKLFTTLAARYADRPGGYTRIHKFGNRPGDNAPTAVLELVDNPRDLRFAMTARAVGWEALAKNILSRQGEEHAAASIVNHGVHDVEELIARERKVGYGEKGGMLKGKTRWNLQKVLRYRGEDGVKEMSLQATTYTDSLLAKPVSVLQPQPEPEQSAEAKPTSSPEPEKSEADKRLASALKELKISDLLAPEGKKKDMLWYGAKPRRAGAIVPGETGQVLHLAQGALAQPRRWQRKAKLGVDARAVFE